MDSVFNCKFANETNPAGGGSCGPEPSLNIPVDGGDVSSPTRGSRNSGPGPLGARDAPGPEEWRDVVEEELGWRTVLEEGPEVKESLLSVLVSGGVLVLMLLEEVDGGSELGPET